MSTRLQILTKGATEIPDSSPLHTDGSAKSSSVLSLHEHRIQTRTESALLLAQERFVLALRSQRIERAQNIKKIVTLYPEVLATRIDDMPPLLFLVQRFVRSGDAIERVLEPLCYTMKEKGVILAAFDASCTLLARSKNRKVSMLFDTLLRSLPSGALNTELLSAECVRRAATNPHISNTLLEKIAGIGPTTFGTPPLINSLPDCVAAFVAIDKESLRPGKRNLLDEQLVARLKILLEKGESPNALFTGTRAPRWNSSVSCLQLLEKFQLTRSVELLREFGATHEYGRVTKNYTPPLVTREERALLPDWLIVDSPKLEEEVGNLIGKIVTAKKYITAAIRSHYGSSSAVESGSTSDALAVDALFQICRGRLVSGYENVPHAEEIASVFSIINLSKSRCAFPIQLKALLQDGNWSELRDQLLIFMREYITNITAQLQSQSFSKVLERGCSQATLMLTALEQDAKVRDPSTATGSYAKHHQLIGKGDGRVLLNDPLLMPDPWPQRYEQRPPRDWDPSSPLISLKSATDRGILGLSFRYAFYELRSSKNPNSGPAGKVIRPALLLDPKALRVMHELILAGEQAPLRILQGLRALASLGGHDELHHIFYTTGGNPQNKFAFAHPDSPFQRRIQLSPEAKGGLHYLLSQWNDFYDAGPFAPAENHAIMARRAIWTDLGEKRPHLHDGILRRFCNYLADLGDTFKVLRESVGSEEAQKISTYFAALAAMQLRLILPINDILSSTVKNRNNHTLKEALEHSGVVEWRPISSDWAKSIIDICGTTRLFHYLLNRYVSGEAPQHAYNVILKYFSDIAGLPNSPTTLFYPHRKSIALILRGPREEGFIELQKLLHNLQRQIHSVHLKPTTSLHGLLRRLFSGRTKDREKDGGKIQEMLLALQKFSLTFSGLTQAQNRELCERIAEEAPDFFYSIAKLARPMTYSSATATLQAETFSLAERARKNGLSTLESLFFGYGPEGRLEVPWIDIAKPTSSTFHPIHKFRKCIEKEVGRNLDDMSSNSN